MCLLSSDEEASQPDVQKESSEIHKAAAPAMTGLKRPHAGLSESDNEVSVGSGDTLHIDIDSDEDEIIDMFEDDDDDNLNAAALDSLATKLEQRAASAEAGAHARLEKGDERLDISEIARKYCFRLPGFRGDQKVLPRMAPMLPLPLLAVLSLVRCFQARGLLVACCPAPPAAKHDRWAGHTCVCYNKDTAVSPAQLARGLIGNGCAGSDHGCTGRPRCARVDANRRRQESVLPAACSHHSRCHGGHHASHLAHARSAPCTCAFAWRRLPRGVPERAAHSGSAPPPLTSSLFEEGKPGMPARRICVVCICRFGVDRTGARVQRRRMVFDELRKDACTIKMLYTTPEQLQASNALVDRLKELHGRCAPPAPPHCLIQAASLPFEFRHCNQSRGALVHAWLLSSLCSASSRRDVLQACCPQLISSLAAQGLHTHCWSLGTGAGWHASLSMKRIASPPGAMTSGVPPHSPSSPL